MSGFTTGQTEEITGLPASTLRFWEKEVPFLAPRKDVFGRRVYSALDICVLSRLKHLAFDKAMGLQKSCMELEKELVLEDPSVKASITEMRISLYKLLAEIRDLGKKRDTIFVTEHEGRKNDGSTDEKST
jgi:DNA-binding transcriptional MerR regulator